MAAVYGKPASLSCARVLLFRDAVSRVSYWPIEDCTDGSNPDSRTRAMLFLIPDCVVRAMPDSRSSAMSFSFPDYAKWAIPDSRPGVIFFSIPDCARDLIPKSESLRKQKKTPSHGRGLGIRNTGELSRITGRWSCCLPLRVRAAVVRPTPVSPPAVSRRPHRSAGLPAV